MAAATTTGALLFTLLAVLFFSSTQGLNTLSCDATHQDLKLIHANSLSSPLRSKDSPLSWSETVIQMQSIDKVRLLYLSSIAAGRNDAHIASGLPIFQNSTYVVQAMIGTPSQRLYLAVDISNDANWVPCSGCAGCPSTTFNTRISSTYRRILCGAQACNQVPKPRCGGRACWFTRTLGNSIVDAKLVQDTIALGTDTIPHYIFGCVQNTTGNSFPAQGLLGLGRGPLSLLSQTVSRYRSTFSYCLPSYRSRSFSGSLRLGPNNQPQITKTTKLLSNPTRRSLYYVNLLGIMVGTTVVKIPPNAFAFDPKTGAGTIVDSGTMFTSLVKSAYAAVRGVFQLQMGNAAVSTLGGFDTCYVVPIKVTNITFMFSGMNVTIPQENFIIRSTSGPKACLAMAAAPDGSVNSVLNVIASFQQQNLRVLINANSVGVMPEYCTRT